MSLWAYLKLHKLARVFLIFFIVFVLVREALEYLFHGGLTDRILAYQVHALLAPLNEPEQPPYRLFTALLI